MDKAVAFSLILSIVMLIFVMGPFFAIWALNTLFHLEIAYTLKTWLAAAWLLAVFQRVSIKKSN